MFKHGMALSHRVKGIESCVWRIYLFVVYFFISDIHIPFSKRSEVDLCVTG